MITKETIKVMLDNVDLDVIKYRNAIKDNNKERRRLEVSKIELNEKLSGLKDLQHRYQIELNSGKW